jgi:hypothetical protein
MLVSIFYDVPIVGAKPVQVHAICLSADAAGTLRVALLPEHESEFADRVSMAASVTMEFEDVRHRRRSLGVVPLLVEGRCRIPVRGEKIFYTAPSVVGRVVPSDLAWFRDLLALRATDLGGLSMWQCKLLDTIVSEAGALDAMTVCLLRARIRDVARAAMESARVSLPPRGMPEQYYEVCHELGRFANALDCLVPRISRPIVLQILRWLVSEVKALYLFHRPVVAEPCGLFGRLANLANPWAPSAVEGLLRGDFPNVRMGAIPAV